MRSHRSGQTAARRPLASCRIRTHPRLPAGYTGRISRSAGHTYRLKLSPPEAGAQVRILPGAHALTRGFTRAMIRDLRFVRESIVESALLPCRHATPQAPAPTSRPSSSRDHQENANRVSRSTSTAGKALVEHSTAAPASHNHRLTGNGEGNDAHTGHRSGTARRAGPMARSVTSWGER
jgi:hypothetical protein